jgi:hypothetical protein
MRDFRAELAGERCWDAGVQAVFEARGEPVVDCVLQNREEFIALCELIEAEGVRSYLEIGVWTGRLAAALDRLFDFDALAACDHGWAEQLGLSIALPERARFLRADSDSETYRAWRASLGHVDLVFIDANHGYRAVKRDFEINRAFSHRFLVFHDIAGASRHTAGVARFWRELDGHKLEILRPHVELGLPHTTMGIGVWSERPFALARPRGSH